MAALLLVVLVGVLSCASSSPVFKDGQYDVPNDTATCANDLIDWCKGMKFPQDNISVSSIAIAISYPEGFCQYFCTADTDGASCTKNGSPWLNCTTDGQLSYKGAKLTQDSTDGDVCKDADRAFNDVFVQNLSYDNSTGIGGDIFENLEKMLKIWSYAQEQISRLNKYFLDAFQFPNFFDSNPGPPYELEKPSGERENPPDDKNDIEREA